MKLTRVGIPAVVLASVLGCKNDNRDNIVKPEIPRTSVTGCSLKYINPKDSSSKIQVESGSGFVVQTNRYAVVPAFLGGTLKIHLEGDNILRHFNPDDGLQSTFFVGSTNDGKVGGFIPSTMFLAEGPGLAKLTVTFYDNEAKEKEKTTYNIEVK
ncbi:MAG: hypothetical protein HY094_04325 [Candidatus Melainabacteria bacterium]|nr:hypothetical protein [Candidatus Melainabacteria bacterium]